ASEGLGKGRERDWAEPREDHIPCPQARGLARRSWRYVFDHGAAFPFRVDDDRGFAKGGRSGLNIKRGEQEEFEGQRSGYQNHKKLPTANPRKARTPPSGRDGTIRTFPGSCRSAPTAGPRPWSCRRGDGCRIVS